MSQLEALLLSLLLEVPLVMLLARFALRARPVPAGRLLVVALAATLITHPFAWHGFGWMRPYLPAFWPRALIIEGAVAVVEGALYATFARQGALRGQLLGWSANAFSFLSGLWLMR